MIINIPEQEPMISKLVYEHMPFEICINRFIIYSAYKFHFSLWLSYKVMLGRTPNSDICHACEVAFSSE